MNEILTTVRDATRALHSSIPLSRVEYLVAALSDDPETIEDLQAALPRFLPNDHPFFANWQEGMGATRFDGGCIIDLPARLVANQSSYSLPGPDEGVEMIGREGNPTGVPFHLADDWLFLDLVDQWESHAEERRRNRRAPMDARGVLYGKVCEFIVDAVWSDPTELLDDGDADDEEVRGQIRAIHARWLETPRDDFGGQAPRDVLLAQNRHIVWQMQDRSHQWSIVGACPPHLPIDSFAHRFAGFGTHEIVVYYYLIRNLLWDCWSQRDAARPDAEAVLAEVRRLEVIRDEWLDTPNFEDLSGSIPRSVIAKERARIPEAMTGAEAMVDHDCPLCQMMADSDNPMFWFLDGSGMDDEFAFSFHKTRAEFEAERREWDERSRRYAEEREKQQATGDESIWKRSFVNSQAVDEAGGAFALFGLGACLAELIEDLKEDGAEHHIIDELNRAFGNLTEVSKDATPALLFPVIEKLSDTLHALAQSHEALEAKCDDLVRQLERHANRYADRPVWDDELPF